MLDHLIPFLSHTFAFDPNSPLLFTQFYFWGFFAVVFAVLTLIHNKLLLRNAFLFFTSLFFYYKTSGSYVCILIFCVIANFFIGKWIEKAEEHWKKKFLMIIVVIIDLLVLCYYKYSYFFLDALYDFTGIELHVYNSRRQAWETKSENGLRPHLHDRRRPEPRQYGKNQDFGQDGRSRTAYRRFFLHKT